MTIGILKEPAYETRVSLLAEAVATLSKKNITVLVESDAGENGGPPDERHGPPMPLSPTGVVH